MNVPDSSILPNDAVIVLVVAGVADRLLNLFRKRRSIFGVYSAQYRFEGHFRCRIQPENAETLLAHVNIPGRNAACPASRVAESLPLGKISLASLQGFFCLLTLRDVPVDPVDLRRTSIHADWGRHKRHIQIGSIFSLAD